MSTNTSQSATTPTGLDKDRNTTVIVPKVNDKDRQLIWKRRRRIQGLLFKHIDDLKVKQVKDGVEELVRPMKTFRRCGFSMAGWTNVKVSVYGDRSSVSNLISCGNAHCPYCWEKSAMEKAKKIQLSLQGAFAHGYQLYFATFTKEKTNNIEGSIEASKDWMTSFTKMFQDHSRNRKIATASYINLEFTLGTVRTKDPDWKDGTSEVFKLHAHNHACIAIHNTDMSQWSDLQQKIETNYVNFMKERGINTFPKGHAQSSVHWESISHPNEGIASYFHKVERELKISSEAALSMAKVGRKNRNLGLFQALDWMESCSRKNREAMELTIARTLVALHGKRGSKMSKAHNFIFRKDAGPLNIGKLGYELKYLGIKSKIEKGKVKPLVQPQSSSSLFEMVEQCQGHDFSHLIDWVARALAMPNKDKAESELLWISTIILDAQRFHETHWKKIEEARILEKDLFGDEEELRWKIVDDLINHCSSTRRRDKGTKRMILSPAFASFFLKLNKYDELLQAIQQLLLYEVNNFTGDWEEVDWDTVEPLGDVEVNGVLWDRLQGQGKAFNLVKRIQDHVRHGSHPLIKSQLEKCVVPHVIDDYIIVETEFDKLVQGLDL